jgi:signal transduction histidine kinase
MRLLRRGRSLGVHARAVPGEVADVEEVAHDLNNVLLAVRGYAELITWDAHSPEAVKSFAEEITCACERANALTGQLIAIESRDTLRRAA